MLKTKIADLKQARAKAIEALEAAAGADEFVADAYEAAKKSVEDIDVKLKAAIDTQTLAASNLQPSADQEPTNKVAASAETDKYVKEKSLIVGGIVKTLGAVNGNPFVARSAAAEMYGERHPVTRALATSTGTAGGFIVPPDVMNEIIPLLRAMAVVRGAGPRNIPMPRGTMTIPGQGSAATAAYGAENAAIAQSQQTLNQITASYKKLTALVPVSNDMMRYADPAVDAFVRDDLVKVMALREDLAFLTGAGTVDTPRGFLSFANAYGSTAGLFKVGAASTAAVGGNWISSNASYTLATVASELGGLINKLDTANVMPSKRVWFMHPRSKNYLLNVQNSLGVYVFRDEVLKGTLLGYPLFTTTQLPINISDASATNNDCSFVILAEMDEAMLFDSMQLQLAVSNEGSYVDSTGATVSAFQNDQTVIRAIAEHDFQLRHDASVAIAQFVRWAPAIS